MQLLIGRAMSPPEACIDYYLRRTMNELKDGNHESGCVEVSATEIKRTKDKLVKALSGHGIAVDDIKCVTGPVVSLFKVYPAAGTKVSAIKSLTDNLAFDLGKTGVRIVILSDCIGIEIPNEESSVVPLKCLLDSETFRGSRARLPLAIGYGLDRRAKVIDLAKAPHILVAGATKQGKSMCINTMVASLLCSKSPSEVKFVLIDPKGVEFNKYRGLPHHYLAVLPNAASEEEEKTIVTGAPDAADVLEGLCAEMEDRYDKLSEAGVSRIDKYNERSADKLPYIVCFIDEFGDLTMPLGSNKTTSRRIMTAIIRLAQKGRAAGIHLIISTQRPSAIIGLIKANFPTRIAFRVSSRIDSMTILDMPGAEKLIGRGDMILSCGLGSERLQGGYVSDPEIESIVRHITEQPGYNAPHYLPMPKESDSPLLQEQEKDERFDEAAGLVVMTQRASASELQIRLGIGFVRAGRIMDQLEAAGIVGPMGGNEPWEVLVKDVTLLSLPLHSESQT